MLERVLEPEVMDSFEDANDYAAMDHREVNRAFVEDMLACGPLEGEVLDVGTGPALIPIELCQHTDDVKVMAVDPSSNMLDVGIINIDIENLRDRIMLDCVDAKDLSLYDDDRFDAVISNSLMHHLADPMPAIREMVRVCAPGGLLFSRDLFRPDSEEDLGSLVDAYCGDDTENQQKMFADSLRAAFTVEEIQSMVKDLGFEANAVQATSDRHWTWTARKPDVAQSPPQAAINR